METVVSFAWTVMETPLGWVTINTIKHLSKDKTSQKHSRKFLIIFSEKSTKFSALETALFLSMRIKKFTFQESIRITVTIFYILRVIFRKLERS